MTALLGVLLNRGIYVCIFDSFNRHIIHISCNAYSILWQIWLLYLWYSISGFARVLPLMVYIKLQAERMILIDGGGGEIS